MYLAESVIEQLFYHKPKNWNRKMTLNEFRNSKFLEHLLYLQIDDDINIVNNEFLSPFFFIFYFFSYKKLYYLIYKT